MGPFSFIQAATVGFFGGATVCAAWIWFLSRRERILLIFAVHCFLCALTSVWVFAITTGTDPVAMNRALRARTTTGLLLAVTTLMLVTRLTGVSARGFVTFLLVAAPVLIACDLLMEPLIGPVVGIRTVHLPWGEVLSAPVPPPPTAWTAAGFAVVISVSTFGVFASWRLWLKDRCGGLLLGLAGAGMLAAHVVAASADVLGLEATYLGAAPVAMWVMCVASMMSREYAVRGEALAASERRFRGIFDQTLQFIGLLTTDGRVIEANRTALKFAGASPADVIGKRFWETPWWAHSTEQQERLRAGIAAAAAGETVRFEATHPRPDGRAVRIDFSLNPVRDEQGRVAMLIPEGRDITDLHFALDENRKLLHGLNERVKELSCLHDVAKVLQNDSADWFGEIARLLPPSLQHPADAAASIRSGDIVCDSAGFVRTPWLLRSDFVDAAGRRGAVEVAYLKPKPPETEGPFLREERNLIDSVAEMLRSAIDRRAAMEASVANERHLRHEKQFVDTLMDALPGIVYLYDAGGRFLKWNKAAERATGWSGEEIATLSPLSFFAAQDTDAVAKSIQRIHSVGRDSIETNLLTKDRKSVPYHFNSVRLQTDHGPCVLGIGIDISERRRLENQFHQAQKMEAVGHLAGGVAHDFNNLLTIISGYSDMLLTGMPESDPNRPLLKEIREAGSRAAALTRQLLAFSRKAVLQPAVFEPNEVVKECENMLRRLIGENIRMTTNLEPDVGRIKADPGQLGQVLMNLCVNARDAMPDGGTLAIETRSVTHERTSCDSHADAEPGRYVVLAVSDTGCGMSPEVQARIFEPFFTTKEVGKGTGLGLAVVYGIVKQSGGHIEIRSEISEGTTFELHFPTVDEPASRRTGESIAEPVRRGSESILLVEDDDGVRGLAQLVLRTYGYRVHAAVDGRDAQRLLDSIGGAVDLLVTDVVMPGMSGRELADLLRVRIADLRVLYVSGYTDDDVFRNGLLRSEVEFLRKPYSPSELVERVRSVLDKRR